MLLISLGALLGFVLLAVVVALVWLRTGTGADELGRFATNEARNAIAGDLKVKAIHVKGFQICVDGAELRDPEGHPVAKAERACVRLRPLALKSHRVALTEVQLIRPWIEIARIPGTTETTLSRAVAARKAAAPKASGPFAWVIDVQSLSLRGGSVTVLPAPGQPATFALEDLDLSQAHARYAQDGAAAALQLAARLVAPGKLPIALALDATLQGAAATGHLDVKTLRLQLGKSGVSASGSWDLAGQSGALALRELVIHPDDLFALTHQRRLEGEVRGEADLKSDGKTAQLALRLDAGGGKLTAQATATLAKPPVWDLQLSLDRLDPGALTAAAPKGEVSARLSLHGKGTPELDAHGVRGELGGALHVGPASLDRIGPVVADLKADLQGRYAIVKAFSATALGLTVKAKGAAAYDEVSLDVEVNAPDLKHVGRAVGALTKKPSLPLAGALHLTARVTGAPQKPDAQVHLRAPQLRWGPTLAIEGLAVDGELHGPLAQPDGSLQVFAQHLAAGNVDLGSPRFAMDLQFPVAHLGIDAGVKDGSLKLIGDATIDDDKDGLVLSNFTISWPGNQLVLRHAANVHFRDQVIVEPLDLVGDHGSLRFQAQLQPPPGRMDVAVVVTKFELDRLPQFALPKDLALHGVLDANAVVQGPRAAPDLDLRADLRGGTARPLRGLAFDAHTHAHVHGGRLKTDGWLASTDLLRVEWNGEAPVQDLKSQPPTAPLQFEARLLGMDVARLADGAKIVQLQQQHAHGRLDLHLVASGTLGAPRATVAVEAHDAGTAKIQHVDARLGLLLEKGRAAVDGAVSLGGAPLLGFTARAPLDLLRALKDGAYLRGALQRPLQAEVAVTQVELSRLAQSGLLPEGSAGKVTLGARFTGSVVDPALQIDAAGEDVTVGRLHNLGFQTQLLVADDIKLTLGAQSQGAAVARLDAAAKLSAEELVAAWRRRAEPDAFAPLLDRAVSLTLEIPGLPIARASQLAGRSSVAEGQIAGRIALTGTPAQPRLQGQIAIKDLASRDKHLGAADLYVEADSAGALLHVGIDPPGGGSLLAHARLQADLGARTLLRDGVASVLDGQVSGDLQAKRLDLAFLSGLAPRLRRTGGMLDAAVKLSGDIAKPVAEGEAHLRRGLFDVVGQGVYEDVGLDATFSPKEVVVDRLTGSTGTGTYSAVLVASRKESPEAASGERIEFTGEVHLGDGESVRDRKLPDGKPLRAAPVPVRQAGEQRADVSGELDLFGDYTDSLLTVNAKIPDARVVIKQLPDKKLPSLRENPDVLLYHPGERPHPPGREPEEVEAEQKAIKESTFRLHGHLDLTHLYVKAADFEFPVESNLNFDYDGRHPDAPTADGTVHVPTGSFSALGRRFAIEDAKIIETGGELEDPELEVKARFENPQANVTITISGTARDPQLDMSSSPPMDQDSIAFFLATGRIQGRATQSGGGVDLSGAATSVLGSLLFGEVRKELANVLPVDVLTIETGAQGVSEASVGKYIGDRIFIGYRQRLVPTQNENTEEGRIEYEISRSVSAEATVGDRNSDLSVLYTKDF